MQLLNEIGIDNAFNLTGGMLAWEGDVVTINQKGLRLFF
jgi:rhodanese-related sulfurtransferase